MTDVAIIGIGMHRFGRTDGVSGLEQGVVAARHALRDAGIAWEDVQFAVGGSMQGGAADTMVSALGLTGVRFTNVVNGCATGGSALSSAVDSIRSGRYDLGMVVGFDKHPRGAFAPRAADHGLPDWYGETGMFLTTQFFALKIQRYMHEHGITSEALARVAAKAFRNGSLNEHAWRRKPLSEEEILAAPMLSHPLTQFMFCNPGEGAVALVVCRADQANRYTGKPVRLRSVSMRSRRFGSFEVWSPWVAAGTLTSVTEDAARAAFDDAGISPAEIDIAQVQDTESGAEVMHMAETGLCAHGEQQKLILTGETEIGGRLPVNTDGGCLANGEPIGASGLRQVYESVLQLRGDAGARQVPGSPRTAFTHVYGSPGVAACTVLST